MGEEQASSTMPCRHRSLLALDIRAQKLGFAAFAEPSRLLGCGIRKYGGTRQLLRDAVVQRITSLLDFYAPPVVVIRKPHVHSPETSRQVGKVINTIRIEAKRRSINVQIVSASTVKKFFSKSDPATKHEIASALAERFEDIAWKLPKKRKVWQSERHNMLIFDAVATGVAFFGSMLAENESIGHRSGYRE